MNVTNLKNFNLTDLVNMGYIDDSTVANLQNEMKNQFTKKVLEAHKLPVKEVYINKGGDGVKQRYFQTTAKWVPSGHIRKKEFDDVINVLAIHYNIKDADDLSFHDVFLNALNKKISKEFVSVKTIKRYHTSYNSYISQELSDMSIQDIDTDFLDHYSKTLIEKDNLLYSAFLKFKGVLNLVFDYATSERLILSDPVANMTETKNFKKGCAQSNSEIKVFYPDDIKKITDEVRRRFSIRRHIKDDGYYVHGYMMLLASITGMRCAELCSLKKADIKKTYIHIHSQQLHDEDEDEYIYVNWTKNEKCHEGVGREFPLFDNVKALLDELFTVQEELGIHSEFVFCHRDGSWIKYEAYQSCLRRLCNRLGIEATNNHSFRKYFNSFVLIPAGFTVTVRAKLLGHSVTTNLQNYSLPPKMIDENNLAMIEMMSAFTDKNAVSSSFSNIITFPEYSGIYPGTMLGTSFSVNS